MIKVQCCMEKCPDDSLTLTESFGAGEILFYCNNHNQVLNHKQVIYNECDE